MDINVNNLNLSSISGIANAALSGVSLTPKAVPASLLKGEGVTVSESSSTTSDVEKLAALLLQEANKAREKSLVSRFSSLGDVLEHFQGQISEDMQARYAEMDKASAEVEKAENEKAAAEMRLDQAKSDLETAKNERDSAISVRDAAKAEVAEARKELDSLTQGAEESDVDFAARKATAESELKSAEAALAKAEGKVTAAEDSVSKLKDSISKLETTIANAEKTIKEASEKIVSVVDSLDNMSFRALSEALTSSVEELNHTNPLVGKDEEEEKVGNTPLSERSPLDIIRDALRRAAGDLLDSLETRREEII